MSRTLRPTRRLIDRCRPRLERLEPRLALSLSPGPDLPTALAISPVSAFDKSASAPLGPNLTVVTTDPAPGATLAKPPGTVSVTFDRPIASSSLLLGFGVSIKQQVNGSWVALGNSQGALTQSLDATQTRLILTPSQSLGTGRYRLVLPEGSPLHGQDGSSVLDTGQDQVLGEFTVAQSGVTLAGAQNLGTPGSNPVVVRGNLDFQVDPRAVQLYKLNVPAGHHWRLGVEVDAQRNGSSLQSVLSLFDAQGHLITTASVSRPDAPFDPYLFAGLDAGTYYLGVSGRGNVPGAPGAYDPSTGQGGLPSQPSTGGAFTLKVVADPADAPTQLTGFRLDHADPLDPSPTGLSLSFSGLLNLDALRGDPSPGVVLVDQNGRAVPMTAVGYDEADARYSFIFDHALTPGRYTVRVPDKAHGGVTDLAGLTPVAPGQPSGVLATFDVAATGNHDPHDLGPLYNEVLTGVGRDDVVAPGSSVTYRFVVLTEGFFRLATQFSGGALGVRLTGGGPPRDLNGGAPGTSVINSVALEPGVYLVRFANTGSTPMALGWTLSEHTHPESLLQNGVGQGPALNLRLIDPASPAATPGATAAAVPSAAPAVPAAAAGPAVSHSGNGPAGLYLTVGDSLVGRPSTQSEPVAVVGPGTVATASSAPGVGQGINYGASAGRLAFPDGPDGAVEVVGGPGEAEPVNGAMVAGAVPAEPGPDDAAVASAEWVNRLRAAAARLAAFVAGRGPAADPTASPVPVPDGPIVLTRDDSPRAASPGQVERAQVGAPLVVGVASVVALRFNRPFRRWLDRHRVDPAARRVYAPKRVRLPLRRS